MKVISRKEAASLGLKRYFTGEKCLHGHIAERGVANWGCLECQNLRAPEQRAKRKEYSAEYRKEYYANNKERFSALQKRWIAANRARVNSLMMKRHCAKLHATPPWLTKEHSLSIREIYAKAQERSVSTGIAHHVDHIVPLRGNGVCGLHVPWNLQILTATENLIKHTSFSA